jgi:hypothetical protein
MNPLPIADWHASLTTMETALQAMLATLDHYQEGWQHLLAESLPATCGSARLLDSLDSRLSAWDSRLAAAAELAASVERQFQDRTNMVGRWQSLYADWQQLIQPSVGPHVAS